MSLSKNRCSKCRKLKEEVKELKSQKYRILKNLRFITRELKALRLNDPGDLLATFESC